MGMKKIGIFWFWHNEQKISYKTIELASVDI